MAGTLHHKWSADILVRMSAKRERFLSVLRTPCGQGARAPSRVCNHDGAEII
jgi:hypothetical protein